MNSTKPKIVLFFFGALIMALLISACDNANRPVLSPNKLSGTVTCGGIFGNNSIGTVGIGADTTMWFSPFVAGSNTMLQSLSVYTSSSGSVTYQLGIYANSVTAPTTLLSSTAPQTIGPVTMWNTAPINPAVYLSSGVTYWLAIHSTISYYSAGGPPYSYMTVPASTYGSLPPTFTGTNSSGLFVFSIYGTTCP